MWPGGHWTRNSTATSSAPAAVLEVTTLGELFTHSMASVSEQHNWEGNSRSGVAPPPAGLVPKEGDEHQA